MFTKTVLSVFICVLFLRDVYSQHRFGCTSDFCAQKAWPCPDLKCGQGARRIRNATMCGCCDLCIESLKKGDRCKTEVFAAIPRHECGPGLKCHKEKKICVSVDTQCVRDQQEFDEKLQSKSGFKKGRPDCDEFGFYKPVFCIPDVLCFCVDKHGQRIFGTDVAANKNTMRCDCSRDFSRFPRSISQGDFLRCLPNGNYNRLQCTDQWCFCMQDSNQDLGYVIRSNTSLEDLHCYDKFLHQEDDAMLRSKCCQKRNKILLNIKAYEDQGILLIGVDLPNCDIDGSYAPLQCVKDSCYCVKKSGEVFEYYRILRKFGEELKMKCDCARDNELLRLAENKNSKMQQFGTENLCDQYGNYKSIG